MKNHLLHTKELTIGYQDKRKQATVVHTNLNLRLLPGEFTCLLGPNGTGKSTLIKTFAGFHPPLGGQIYLGNQNLKQIKEKDLARLVSVVLTDKTHVGNMTIFELVSMGRHPYTGFFGNLTHEDLRIIHHAIDSVGMLDMRQRLINELSDGERQKAMIAKALAQQTPIIILDEPTAYLDLPSRIEIMQLLHSLSSNLQKAILLSTHDLEQALRFADKIWLLGRNRQVQSGTPEDLILSDQFKKFFERKGIRFDNLSGTFKITNPRARKVRIIGQGLEYNWILNALRRNGYTEANDADLSIEIRKNGSLNYVLRKSTGENMEIGSVENLIHQIKTLEGSNN
jgi:iron complex transport system ATP-binding protein